MQALVSSPAKQTVACVAVLLAAAPGCWMGVLAFALIREEGHVGN